MTDPCQGWRGHRQMTVSTLETAAVATVPTLWIPAINNHGGFGRWPLSRSPTLRMRRTFWEHFWQDTERRNCWNMVEYCPNQCLGKQKGSCNGTFSLDPHAPFLNSPAILINLQVKILLQNYWIPFAIRNIRIATSNVERIDCLAVRRLQEDTHVSTQSCRNWSPGIVSVNF